MDHIAITADQPFTYRMDGKAYDISVKIKWDDTAAFQLSLFGFDITYNAENNELKCMNKSVAVVPTDEYTDLRVIIDTVYAEIFVNQGNPFLGMTYIQDSSLNTLKITAECSVHIEHLEISKLQNFWK